MRSLFICLSIFCSMSYCFAQSSEGSILYRRSKAKLIGHVIEEGKLVNLDGDTVLYDPSDVYYSKRYTGRLMYSNGRSHLTSGIFGLFDLSIGLDQSTHTHITMGIGKRLDKDLSLGLGLGFHANAYSLIIPSIGPEPGELWIEALTTNVSIFSRYNLSDWRKRPYLSGELGYGFSSDNDWDNLETQKGGLNAQFGVGVQLPSRRNTRYYFELRQYFQKFSGTSIQSENPLATSFDIDIWFKQISLTMGFTWK